MRGNGWPMSEQWSDDRALAVYRRVFPGDQVWPGADPRSAAIAEEMRMVKAAPTAEAACAVIAWWGDWEDERALLRAVQRIRRAR